MLTTSTIQDYLLSPEKTLMIKSAIQEGAKQYGMQTFDQSLMQWYSQNVISYDSAMFFASNPAEFALRVQGIGGTSDSALGSACVVRHW